MHPYYLFIEVLYFNQNTFVLFVGIAVKDEPVAGVIFEPFHCDSQTTEQQNGISDEPTNHSRPLGRALWGIVGVGAFGFESQSPPEGSNVIATKSGSGADVLNRTAVNACEPTSILTLAGVGRKVRGFDGLS